VSTASRRTLLGHAVAPSALAAGAVCLLALLPGLGWAGQSQPAPRLSDGRSGGDSRLVWRRTWNTVPPGTLTNPQVASSAIGRAYVAATLQRLETGLCDIGLVAFSPSGALRWTQTWDGEGAGDDRAMDIARDRHGCILICGSTRMLDGDLDWCVLKYGADGQLRWARTLCGTTAGEDRAVSLTVDRDRNVYATGSVANEGCGLDWMTAKYSPAGVLLWSRTYDGAAHGDDEAVGLALDARANVYVTGSVWSSQGGRDVVTTRYGSTGGRVWLRRWVNTNLADGDDVPHDIAVRDCGVVVVGSWTNEVSVDCLAIVYRRDGRRRWWHTMAGHAYRADEYTSVGMDAKGRIVAGGQLAHWSMAMGERMQDYLVVWYTPGGDMPQWMLVHGTAHPVDGVVSGRVNDVLVSSHGDAWITGWTTGEVGGRDVCTESFCPDRMTRWGRSWDALTSDDVGQSLSLSSDALFVAGLRGADLLLLKYRR